MGKTVFDLVKGKKFFLIFSPFLAFNKTKEHILFQVQALKMLIQKFLLILGLQAKCSEAF